MGMAADYFRDTIPAYTATLMPKKVMPPATPAAVIKLWDVIKATTNAPTNMPPAQSAYFFTISSLS